MILLRLDSSVFCNENASLFPQVNAPESTVMATEIHESVSPIIQEQQQVDLCSAPWVVNGCAGLVFPPPTITHEGAIQQRWTEGAISWGVHRPQCYQTQKGVTAPTETRCGSHAGHMHAHTAALQFDLRSLA